MVFAPANYFCRDLHDGASGHEIASKTLNLEASLIEQGRIKAIGLRLVAVRYPAASSQNPGQVDGVRGVVHSMTDDRDPQIAATEQIDRSQEQADYAGQQHPIQVLIAVR